MEIRLAKAVDRETWFRLWREFVEEQYEQGSVIVPSGQTYRQYLQLFDAYTVGSLFGLVLLAETTEPNGIPHVLGTCMGGESPAGLGFETLRGKSAILWGVYTIPEYRKQGISNALLTRAKEIGADLGFNTVLSEILPHEGLQRNALAAGTIPYTTTVWAPLEKK